MCICLCLHLCITVIYLSILWKSQGVYFTLCYFLLIFRLTCPSFSNLWISLTCSLYLGFFCQFSLLCQLGERYTVLYLTSSVTTANSEISCISNCSLVKEDEPPFNLHPWGSMRRNEWDGNTNDNGCHCWDWKIPWRRRWQSTPVFLPGKSNGWRSLVGYSPCGHKESDTTEWLHFHFIYITSLIPKIPYLEGLYCYILPFYRRGDWDTTWSYSLPKIAEQNQYWNLCLCHSICRKFW